MLKVNIMPLGRMSVNCYIVYDEDTHEGAVIDPGGEDSAEAIAARCNTLGVNVKYILLTHAHFDHILSLEALRKKLGVPVAIHKDDAEALTDPTLTYMAQFGGVNQDISPAEVLLDEGSTITLGKHTLTVMHTPGHTMGSVCYNSDAIIFTGDTLFGGSIGRCDLYGGDEDAIEESLKRLIRLEGDYKLYPGHGGTTTMERQRQTNLYVRHLQ